MHLLYRPLQDMTISTYFTKLSKVCDTSIVGDPDPDALCFLAVRLPLESILDPKHEPDRMAGRYEHDREQY